MDRVLMHCIVLLAALVAGCTTVHMQAAPPALDRSAPWALLPVVNHTQTPQAGLRAEAILESLVRARGVHDLEKYPTRLNSESLFEPAERAAVDKAMTWAQELEVSYALTGTVDEWRYKVGVDGEPAVGITLQLIEMRTGRVVWTAAGSKTGWSREALSAVAQKLLSRLTQPLAASPAGASSQPAKSLPKPIAPGQSLPLPQAPEVPDEPQVKPAAKPVAGSATRTNDSRTASLNGV